MSAPTYREREVILRERAAFVVGARWQRLHGGGDEFTDTEASAKDALNYFQLPKIERPRVVKDSKGCEWRVCNGRLQWANRFAQHKDDRWRDPASLAFAVQITTERVNLLADLLANPVELVDEDSLSSSEGVERREDKV